MKTRKKHFAFSTVEILVTVAILAILAGILLGFGRGIRTQAEDKLAQSTIDVIVTALEQYYDFHGDFPFVAQPYVEVPPSGYGQAALQATIEQDNGLALGSSTITGAHEDEYSSSEALFYFLNKLPASRRIIDVITDTQITNKGSDGGPLKIEAPTGSFPIDLIRFIDPWGMAFRYTYTAGDNFPLIESGGADRDLATMGDNITSQ